MLQSIVREAQQWRRDIHAHPETAFEEFRTSKIVEEKLRSFGLDVHTGLAGTGVVATLDRGVGPHIAFRADMDALHIHEKNTFAHRSTVDGKMHACGHDGHTSMLLGAARYLSQYHDDLAGTLHFIFQPAEENEAGGKRMVEEGLFEKFPAEEVYGLHNWPGLPAGSITALNGPQMAAFDLFEIKITGSGTHAAMPHQGTDSIVAGSTLVSMLQTIVSRSVDPLDTAVVSVTQFHGGDTWNIIPEEVILRGCTRHFKIEVQEQIKAAMQRLCEHVSQAFQVEATLWYDERYPSVVNNATQADYSRQVARSIVSEDLVFDNLPPSMASEDFSFMLREVPGCYAWIGNGDGHESRSLHNPHYDFNDEILERGIRYWVGLAQHRLG
ncbi:MAG: amidohydrolase [Parvularculaceae bacterium]|nr:amidohydrolase [Parvularculaceae bacterium]